MKRKIRRSKKMLDEESVIIFVKKVVLALLSGAFGFGVNWLFDGNIILGISIFAVLSMLCLIGWVVAFVCEEHISILHILDQDLRRGKYYEVIKLGEAVSRPFFLAGKNRERYMIGEKMLLALDHMQGEIIIENNSESVMIVKSKIYIDDVGWSLYLCDRFNNRKSAEKKIKEGIKQCLRFAMADENHADAYSHVFKGIRHLLAMSYENFDETSVEVLTKSPELYNQYKVDINKYGGILGYLLDDTEMADLDDEKQYLNVFKSIVTGVENAAIFFDALKKWVDKSIASSESFVLSTYNFRTKYFLARAKMVKIEKGSSEETDKFLGLAKENALLMSVGYASGKEDLEWLKSTFSFKETLVQILEKASVKSDVERFVKSYLLLGTVAVAYGELEQLKEAKTAFVKAVDESRRINRIDTYVSAQRKLVATNEKIFMKNYQQEYSKADARIDLITLRNSMNQIQTDTKQFLGYPDEKMTKSCKERKKRYRKIESQIRKGKEDSYE